tara:strand:- start:1962 stop:3407 length:1446 start_codon:yes stop_codon:yes gene_type:complete
MIFNSVTYLLLLFLVVLFYWILPNKFRLILIFSSSLIFYSFWKILFTPILLISVIVNWKVGNLIYHIAEKKRTSLLILSLFFNLGLLFFFKYFIFFSSNTIGLANYIGLKIDPFVLKIILPLGISFFTFQAISYVVDIYRGFIKPEKNFTLFACYITFFPQLIAGPILRASEVIPQFKNKPLFLLNHILVGMRFILYGFFLKVVFADTLSILVDSGFNMNLKNLSAIDVWTLAFLFGFQIYFDFSAYSYIALGSARMMGIIFPNNFNFPYISSSPREFWQRWHISLSSWIRDYIYLPLNNATVENKSKEGFKKIFKITGTTKSLFITWGIMGFWHGANWTFLLWGLYHAILISAYRLIEPKLRNFSNIFKLIMGISITLPLIMLSWIPFRSSSLSETFGMWSKIFYLSDYTWMGMRENTYIITFLILIGIFIIYIFKERILPNIKSFEFIIVLFDIIIISVITYLVIVFFGSVNQFIYFQF